MLSNVPNGAVCTNPRTGFWTHIYPIPKLVLLPTYPAALLLSQPQEPNIFRTGLWSELVEERKEDWASSLLRSPGSDLPGLGSLEDVVPKGDSPIFLSVKTVVVGGGWLTGWSGISLAALRVYHWRVKLHTFISVYSNIKGTYYELNSLWGK